MSQEAQDNLTKYIKYSILDRALLNMIRAGHFTQWFREKVMFEGYDILYGTLNCLPILFAQVYQSALTEISYTANQTKLKIVVSQRVLMVLLGCLGVKLEEAQAWANILEKTLLEVESTHKEFYRQRSVLFPTLLNT